MQDAKKRRTKKSKQYDVLALLWATGIGIAISVALALQAWGKFSLLDESDKLHYALSIGVALMTLSLFVSYVVATHWELSLLRDYIGESEAPRMMPKTYIAFVLLALVFGLLITLSDKILWYSLVLVTYNLADLWGSWQVARMLEPMIKRTEAKTLDPEDRNAVETIRRFYFDNPTLPRIVTMMFFDWVAVCFALSFHFTGLLVYRNTAYIIVLATIIGGEIVIQWWRAQSIYKLD